MKSFIKQVLLWNNIILSRPPGQFSADTVKLNNLRRRGFSPRFAIDGGADRGGWSRDFRKVFPDCQILAIEPRQAVQSELEKTSKELGSMAVAQVVLAESERLTSFNEHGAQSSILNSNNVNRFGRTGEVKTTTLDLLMGQMDLGFPDFIKLDLQGAELLCLEGASKCLGKVVFIQLELSFIELYEKSPLFDEVIAFMKQRGFICYDILGLWHRPLDGALAQGDFLFIRETHPLRSDKRWSQESTWCG